MMEKILFGLLFFLDWVVLSTCLHYQYYFVDQSLNWTEAQTYCRKKHTDLATILNPEEQNQLNNTLTSAGHSSDVWIGMFSEINWKWSDGYTGSGADYRHWTSNQPYITNPDEYCVGLNHNRGWADYICTGKHHFMCYKAMTWSDAQMYCRENFLDLATIKNDVENQQVQSLTNELTWIGLYREPNLLWSDGSSVLFRNIDSINMMIGSKTIICGAAATGRSGRWKGLPCETRLPFVCYGLPVMKKQVVRLRFHADGSVDLNDPVLRGKILKKLQKKLQENGVSGVTLKWR
ncbi:PREDICTED: macrophage mannose receptor 1-like [Cyprinodon variegatus]|uniref:macrophage mannose receptor 1-like n=1 Tax=Cyprinodon variegatus TaxID=28743 RepID=UPI000742A137|nr:PREDICTED: macrophage mannose receptor 1-like [Cyprinodon variegatus]